MRMSALGALQEYENAIKTAENIIAMDRVIREVMEPYLTVNEYDYWKDSCIENRHSSVENKDITPKTMIELGYVDNYYDMLCTEFKEMCCHVAEKYGYTKTE